MKTYVIQRGDSLFKVAQKFYGDGYKYELLAAYNGMSNPNAIEVGQVLQIPDVQELDLALSDWHNYQSGKIYWRLTVKGVEVKGQGILLNSKFTTQAKKIWETFRAPILAASKKHRVPVPAIIATISTESSGNPQAYRYEPAFYTRYIQNKAEWKNNPYSASPKRISASYGLMQIMYTTAYNVGFRGKPEDLYDPQQNLDVGCAYIASAYQVKQHGWDPPKIACAYNAGSVRPTTENAWGMYCHAGHLDRWIPSYNGAIEAIGAQAIPQVITPPATEIQPPISKPQPAEQPPISGANVVTLQLLLPKTVGKTWQPLIVDLFQLNETGIGEPFSFTINQVKTREDGYSYERPNIAKGVYDLVFTDAATGAVLYDIAEVELTTQPTQLDLRQALAIPSPTPTVQQKATLRIGFPKIQGQVWKPVIIDLFKHQTGGTGTPLSYTVKIPSYGPAGEYIYDIPNIDYGVYDLVFTDAASQSVMDDIADCAVQQPLVIVEFRAGTRRDVTPPSETPSVVSIARGLGDIFKAFWNKFWS
ncbi:hypothetical protein U27_07006 [Candidatus Vecturithrix granuli]|uniref:LysM domain-containing protein n=1 Tax=Vecturithrix granuli TaxID=1499967 RepID=A0A081C614_VECG1|nr:hypothetical protein U27_07006 [Candidatus Vecturithrix granuli]